MSDLKKPRPEISAIQDIDSHCWSFDFDRTSDTLYWDFYGEPRSAVSYPVTDHILLSVDPKSDQITCLQFDGFLGQVIYEIPAFLEMADQLGLSAEEVRSIRSRLSPEAWSRTALRSVLEMIGSHVDEAASVA